MQQRLVDREMAFSETFLADWIHRRIKGPVTFKTIGSEFLEARACVVQKSDAFVHFESMRELPAQVFQRLQNSEPMIACRARPPTADVFEQAGERVRLECWHLHLPANHFV